MKLFHKHPKISAPHEITNNEWERVIDKIYLNILSFHSSIYCIATNTDKENNEDKIGTISNDIIFRFHKKIDDTNHKIISKVNRDIFNDIFQNYNKIDKEKRSDFFHIEIKNINDTNYLVYPLHQSLDKKALLFCVYPNDEMVLNKIINRLLIYWEIK